MSNKKVRLSTPDGIAEVGIELLGWAPTDHLAIPENQAVDAPLGYRACVLECHKVLDNLQIPPAKGESCSDPTCESPLGHRLRELRRRYLVQLATLQAIKESPEKAAEILEEGFKTH